MGIKFTTPSVYAESGKGALGERTLRFAEGTNPGMYKPEIQITFKKNKTGSNVQCTLNGKFPIYDGRTKKVTNTLRCRFSMDSVQSDTLEAHKAEFLKAFIKQLQAYQNQMIWGSLSNTAAEASWNDGFEDRAALTK